MKVVVKVFAVLRDLLGWKERVFELDEEASLIDLIRRIDGLKELILEGGELHPDYRVFINGRYIGFLDGLSTRLFEGDVVAIFPAMAGG